MPLASWKILQFCNVMAFRAMDVIAILWSHPILSLGVLLLFTPPLFPIVVYFSPLLISTALFVLAMVSMGTDQTETPHYGNAGIPYKRNWIDDKVASEDGPQLEDERVAKRLRATDETWFDKVKNWEGTGRAWMESVLSQESRRSFPSSEFHNAPVVTVRRLPSTTEFFGEILQKNTPAGGRTEGPGAGEIIVREPQQQPEHKEQQLVVSQSADGNGQVDEKEAVSKAAATGTKDESANNNSVVPAELSESVDSRSLAVVAPGAIVVSSEITPALETDDDDDERSSIAITAAAAPRKVPPSPLFRSWSVSKAAIDNHSGPVVVTEASSKVQDVSSKDIKDSSELKQSVSVVPALSSGTTEGERKNKSLISNSAAEIEGHIDPPVLTKKEPAAEGAGKGMTGSSLGKENNNDAPVTGGEAMIERKFSDATTERTSSASLGAKTQTRNATDSGSESGGGQSDVVAEIQQQPPREPKAGAELLDDMGPAVPGAAKAFGATETPSAAVALSEKLNVPLADIMSLLAGDDKDNATPNQTPSGVKASTSSETTTSQEEEWSSSDDGEQSSGAATVSTSVDGVAGTSSVEKNDGRG